MNTSKLYCGNLNYAVTEDELKELFSEYGEVVSVKIIEGKGFGFIEFSSVQEAEEAKEKLNDTEFRGRTMKVNEARPPRERRDSRQQRRW